jgi:phosphoglycolate phosphatase
MPASASPIAVVLDLDGTLVESAPDLRTALNVILRRHGRRLLGLDEVKGMIGDGLPALVQRGFLATGGLPDDRALEHAVNDCGAYYQQHCCVASHLYPGVAQTLSAMRAGGHAMAVCTNKPVDSARALLRALDIHDSLDALVGGDSYPFRKPDPRALLRSVEQLGAKPEDAVMVGDSLNDAMASRGAGMRFVLATYGYNTIAVEELAPDAVIDVFSDLPECLEGL